MRNCASAKEEEGWNVLEVLKKSDGNGCNSQCLNVATHEPSITGCYLGIHQAGDVELIKSVSHEGSLWAFSNHANHVFF